MTVEPDTCTEQLRLPASKTDTQALGCNRAWSCVCVNPDAYDCTTPCPYHAAVCLRLELARRFCDRDGQLPPDLLLFPNDQGAWCDRDSFVRTIIQMAEDTAVDLYDDMGRFTAGEHVWRVSGSRMLARASITLPQIMLMARWGSDIILRYVSDAPLANISREYMTGITATGSQGGQNPVVTDTPAVSPPAIQTNWEDAIKNNSPTEIDLTSFPARERFAINPSTAFAHVVAKRKAWERPVHGRTVCGQDFRGRGYRIFDILPLSHLAERGGVEVPVQRCTECAKPKVWQALLDAPPAESDTDSD